MNNYKSIADSDENAQRIRSMSHSREGETLVREIVTSGVRHGAESSQFSLRFTSQGKAMSIMDGAIQYRIG